MRLASSRGFIIATAPIMTVVTIACANGTNPIDLDDEGGIGDASRDLAVIPLPGRDSATPPGDGGQDTGTDAPLPTGTHVVINEIQTAGSGANSELVELYNPTGSTVSLANWEVRYASAGGGAGGAGHKFNGAASIPANGYLVLKPSDNTWTAGMAATAGQVGLFDATLPTQGKLIDGVAYGTGSGGSTVYREGQSAPSPPTGGSIGRSPNGVDSDSNKNDFRTYTTLSAGSANP